MNANFVIETEDLTKNFGGVVAVNNVNLKIRLGSIHALIGPNGAGKTTVFSMLSKFLAPSKGVIRFNGNDITALKPHEVSRNGIARSFQISSVFPHLSATENVVIALQQSRSDNFHFWRSDAVLEELREKAEGLLDAVGIFDSRSMRAVDLPYGRKRALEIATTLALDPKVLLLDEPMAGLGREDVSRIAKLIRTVSANRTVVMVEHNLSVVAELSDFITVLARGSVLAEGIYADVSTNPAVLEAYIGTSHD